MSKATEEAIEQAIAAHVREALGDNAVLTGFIVQIKGQNLSDTEQRTWYQRVIPPTQPLDASIGLGRIFTLGLDEYWRED